MFVNVSPLQLERDEFTDEVRTVLSVSRLAPENLLLEITETTLMRGAETASRLLALKSLGVGIAIDDFGTGYSSLAYLHEFPVDAVKIDRSFISGTTASRECAGALVHSLVQLGKTLGMTTVAEGIEDDGALARLIGEECDLGQGFFLARPADAAAIEALITAHPSAGATGIRQATRGGIAIHRPRLSLPPRPQLATARELAHSAAVSPASAFMYPGRRVLCEHIPRR
jgi:EAL domain-containing protein (putative c-di-GMP-specific phosphodiesterase class I)